MALQLNTTATNITVASYEWKYFTFDVTETMSSIALVFRRTGGMGDPDFYIKYVRALQRGEDDFTADCLVIAHFSERWLGLTRFRRSPTGITVTSPAILAAIPTTRYALCASSVPVIVLGWMCVSGSDLPMCVLAGMGGGW